MTLRIIGAGLPRTGTTSLKAAIELVTGESCYHMFEVLPRRETQVPLWERVLDGDHDAFDEIFAAYGSAIDWPASAFWRELAERYPDATVILSRRADSATWWRSVDRTVWQAMRVHPADSPMRPILDALRARFHEPLDDADGAMAAYERHLDEVREAIPPDRLVEMTPGEGWGPLCAALGVAVPDEPYPHNNSTADFRAMAGWD